MATVVDIYMPDFKYWGSALSKKYLIAKDYPDAARQIIKEMHWQVGEVVFDENGLAKPGVLVRHLVMPDSAVDSRHIMRHITHEVSSHTYVNVMSQYRPAGKVNENKHTEINCETRPDEVEATISIAREEGLYRFDNRSPTLKIF